jgi:hypothetical protein
MGLWCGAVRCVVCCVCVCVWLVQALWRGLIWLNESKEGAEEVVQNISKCLRLLTRTPDFIAGESIPPPPPPPPLA